MNVAGPPAEILRKTGKIRSFMLAVAFSAR